MILLFINTKDNVPGSKFAPQLPDQQMYRLRAQTVSNVVFAKGRMQHVGGTIKSEANSNRGSNNY